MSFLITILLSITLQGSPVLSEMPEVVTEKNKAPEIALSLQPPLISGESIKIGYKIPYPGYIEFFLYDSKGEQIWLNTYVRERGEHVQAINRTKLEKGGDYTFAIWYKGKKYTGKFTA